MTRKRTRLVALFTLLFSLSTLAHAQDRPEGWEEITHSNRAPLDYAIVFPQNTVNTITITLTPQNWQTMLQDMTDRLGSFGFSRGGSTTEIVEGISPTPIWVDATLAFNGREWQHIGIRFKGSSSLQGTWARGIYKLPFRLNFDNFEDEYPQIRNQRFYGFQKLSFANHWADDTLLRQKMTSEIFTHAGVITPQTAFYAVYVNYGEGDIYFGLYTATEIIDDTVLQTQFENAEGNLYQPEGQGATFATGTFLESDFVRQTNADSTDYSDVKALFDALHSETRQSNPTEWRQNLEAVFDVEGFLRWLAINSLVLNFDTYGVFGRNYFLYQNIPARQLTWIPWDFDFALMRRIGSQHTADSLNPMTTLGHQNIGAEWALIRYLLDEPVYHERYIRHVQALSERVFIASTLEQRVRTLALLIAPYVQQEQPLYTNLRVPNAFDDGVEGLIAHIYERQSIAQAYLQMVLGSP